LYSNTVFGHCNSLLTIFNRLAAPEPNAMSTDYLLIYSTCPDLSTAERIAQQLVEAELAACVSIIPGLTSIYKWQGAIEQNQEVLLMIKSRGSHYAALELSLRQHHPHELPEIIAVPIERGLPPYLNWIDESLNRTL